VNIQLGPYTPVLTAHLVSLPVSIQAGHGLAAFCPSKGETDDHQAQQH